MSARTIATVSVIALVLLAILGTFAWDEWKSSRVERIPFGATKRQVLDALGEPDVTGPGGFAFDCGDAPVKECWHWKLTGQSYVGLCFDASGKVVCHDSFAIWT
jgi:hypothetical protein